MSAMDELLVAESRLLAADYAVLRARQALKASEVLLEDAIENHQRFKRKAEIEFYEKRERQ